MKTMILTLILPAFLFSCNKSISNKVTAQADLIGTWKLIEVLADPGDGSGTFHSVNSNKTILFDSNGNVSSNGTMCDMSIESNTNTSGTYSEINSTITPANCPTLQIRYTIEGNNLIVSYPCIEACKIKYVKVK